MQFKVPQDVQQADRIVSFLTLPQLIICVIGFAIAYGVYAALNNQGLPMVFWLPPVIIIAAITMAFAFLRIANLPFHHYLALLIERFITPSKRVWVKGGDRVVSTEPYVTPEEKKSDEKNKKLNELQHQKEEKLQNISEITDVLDTLKKEPEKEAELEQIDQADDKELLQKSFLEEVKTAPEKPKKPETAEDKIKAISQLPKNETPSEAPAPEPISVPAQTPEIAQKTEATASSEEPKKKKRRRRRRKKRSEKSIQQEPLKTVETAPAQEAKAPVQVKRPPEKKPVEPVATDIPVKPAMMNEPPIPEWLNEPPAAQPEPNTMPSTEQPVESPQAPKTESKPLTETESKPLTETESKQSESSNSQQEELELKAPEPELELEAPEPELDLPAPKEELELEAPEPELDLPAPKEEPRAPETSAEAQPKTPEPANPTNPTIPTIPTNPTDPALLKPEETFTADQLKQGQVIKIPKAS